MIDEEGFSARIDADEDRVVLWLSGDLDGTASTTLRAAIDDWPLVADTVIDLTGLRFIDSTGIGCVLKLQQRVADAGGLLVARGVAPGVRRVLEATGVNRTLAIVDAG